MLPKCRSIRTDALSTRTADVGGHRQLTADLSPATAFLESDVDDWIHMPAVTLAGRFVAVYRAGR